MKTFKAFTIGKTSLYDPTVAGPVDGRPKKVGRRDDYSGGVAWETADEARAYLASPTESFAGAFDPSEYAVYELGLVLPFQDGTYAGTDGLRFLTEDALIVARAV
jgi:hypothetical protein